MSKAGIVQNNSENLTIALPISSFLPAAGGAEIGLHNIASILKKKNCRPVVITSYTHLRALRSLGLELPYEVIAYPPKLLTLSQSNNPLGKKLLFAFYHYLQSRYRFDIWHATIGYPVGVSVIEFCRKTNVPHLVRCVGEDIQIRPELNYGMRLDPEVDRKIRKWLPKADSLVAITESVVGEYHDIGCSEDIITRIPNGIDLPRFLSHVPTENIRQRLGIDGGKFIFLTVGRNHPKKNLSQMIEAAERLSQCSDIDFEVLIVGTDVGKLDEQVQQKNMTGIVRLLEPGVRLTDQRKPQLNFPSDEILDYYSHANCFVIPSLIETFGIVAAEAMGAGLPVIAADSPGCRDVVNGGRDGLLYSGDIDALVDAMQQMLEDNLLLEHYAARARDRVRNFDWNVIVDRYKDLYTHLINHRQRPAKQDGLKV